MPVDVLVEVVLLIRACDVGGGSFGYRSALFLLLSRQAEAGIGKLEQLGLVL